MSKIFISYRREDSADICGRLDDKLAAHFGRDNVFKDVDSIPLGADFRQVLQDAVGKCSAMLVVIGRRWVDITDAGGRQRLESPADFVRIEVEAALARNIPVIPVLVQGASVPLEHELPDSLSPLAFRHGIELRGDPHFHRDADQLIVRLTPVLEAVKTRLPPYQVARDRFPIRLEQLGFIVHRSNGVEYILPPLCEVPAGPFLMGSYERKDVNARNDELPRHHVTLPDYQIARYPVTVAEYACFVRVGHRQPISSHNDLTWQQQLVRLEHPVVNVSWHDAVAYAIWLARCSGQPWRLPTEAEWEKAARGTEGLIYPWGDLWDRAHANIDDGVKRGITPIDRYPAGASTYGALDLVGNVWEWTSTLYKPYPYTATDGREAPNSARNRVLRGGSWFNFSVYARTAYRRSNRPDYLNNYGGFRLCVADPIAS